MMSAWYKWCGEKRSNSEDIWVGGLSGGLDRRYERKRGVKYDSEIF